MTNIYPGKDKYDYYVMNGLRSHHIILRTCVASNPTDVANDADDMSPINYLYLRELCCRFVRGTCGGRQMRQAWQHEEHPG